MLEIIDKDSQLKYGASDDLAHEQKSAYLKITVDGKEYLILLSEVIEIKNTNLITPVQSDAMRRCKIYGTFYFQQEIIPVYKLCIKLENDAIKVLIKNTVTDLSLKKYQNLLILRQEGYLGLIIEGHSNSEIIEIMGHDDIEKNNFNVIDIKQSIRDL